jgi:hypothetical protein
MRECWNISVTIALSSSKNLRCSELASMANFLYPLWAITWFWKMRRDLKSQNINNSSDFIWNMTNKPEVLRRALRIPTYLELFQIVKWCLLPCTSGSMNHTDANCDIIVIVSTNMLERHTTNIIRYQWLQTMKDLNETWARSLWTKYCCGQWAPYSQFDLKTNQIGFKSHCPQLWMWVPKWWMMLNSWNGMLVKNYDYKSKHTMRTTQKANSTLSSVEYIIF